jgi:HlyD family type I secretion membrane fusion protein
MSAVMTSLPQGAANDPSLAVHQAEADGLARWGRRVLVFGLVPVLAWLAFAPLSSAVVAPSYVKVDLDRRPVQHAEGGIVREVKVRDGQHVKAGEPLIVLGDVAVAADADRLDLRVGSERAGIARLEAEQAGAAQLVFSGTLLKAASQDPRLAEQLQKERALFAARRDAVVGQAALLQSQRAKVLQEMDALRAQIVQSQASLQHQREELESNRSLVGEGYVPATRISQLEAGVADYAARLEEKRSELSRAEQRVVDTDLRVKTLTSEYRQQASDQLKVALMRAGELQQEQRKAGDAAARQVIAAPADGEVVNLRYATPGAVVQPRETVADIVPAHPRLVVEAHLRTDEVSRVEQGQAADIRFTAFKYRTTRLVQGKVFYVAPDRTVDRNNGNTYYVALVEADAASLAQAEGVKLQAGMPAEVYIRGEQRTPLQYLLEPVTQVLRRAGRER